MEKIRRIFRKLIKAGYYPYNWHHADQEQAAAIGWHIPTKADMKNLKKHLKNGRTD